MISTRLLTSLVEEGLETQWYDDQHWIEEFCEAGPDGMPHEMVAKAKQEEMERFARMKVYEVVPKHEVDHDNSVVIGSRWVITNKGTPEMLVAKARLVAQEFADNTLQDELFAGTPNPTSVKYFLSRLCTRSHVEPKQDKVLMLLDVKSAFLYGTCRRSVYIRLQPEDSHASSGDCYDRLLKAMHGTRDAPQVWHEHLRLVMERLGFAESKIMPGVYVKKSTGIEVATHVDFFLVVGCENVLKDFYNALLKEFELKCTLLGGGKQHQRSGLYLGRTITWTTWEPAQVLIRTLGLEQCKPSATPYCQESKDI